MRKEAVDLKQILEQGKTMAQPLIEGASNIASQVKSKVQPGIESAVSGVKDVAGNAGGAISGAFDQIGQKGKSVVQEGAANAHWDVTGKEIPNEMFDTAGNVGQYGAQGLAGVGAAAALGGAAYGGYKALKGMIGQKAPVIPPAVPATAAPLEGTIDASTALPEAATKSKLIEHLKTLVKHPHAKMVGAGLAIGGGAAGLKGLYDYMSGSGQKRASGGINPLGDALDAAQNAEVEEPAFDVQEWLRKPLPQTTKWHEPSIRPGEDTLFEQGPKAPRLGTGAADPALEGLQSKVTPSVFGESGYEHPLQPAKPVFPGGDKTIGPLSGKSGRRGLEGLASKGTAARQYLAKQEAFLREQAAEAAAKKNMAVEGAFPEFAPPKPVDPTIDSVLGEAGMGNLDPKLKDILNKAEGMGNSYLKKGKGVLQHAKENPVTTLKQLLTLVGGGVVMYKGMKGAKSPAATTALKEVAQAAPAPVAQAAPQLIDKIKSFANDNAIPLTGVSLAGAYCLNRMSQDPQPQQKVGMEKEAVMDFLKSLVGRSPNQLRVKELAGQFKNFNSSGDFEHLQQALSAEDLYKLLPQHPNLQKGFDEAYGGTVRHNSTKRRIADLEALMGGPQPSMPPSAMKPSLPEMPPQMPEAPSQAPQQMPQGQGLAAAGLGLGGAYMMNPFGNNNQNRSQ